METLIISLPIFFLCLVIHEYAHGWMADRCGDSTARYMGRLTLNPLAHLDPIGTILLPIILLMSHSRVIFGWAKPVPINPYNFRSPRWDTVKVGLAGPGANIIFAIVSAIIIRIITLLNFSMGLFGEVLGVLVLLNLILAFFNLVPIPPLDGSRVVSGLLPPSLAYRYDRLERYGFLIVIVLVYLGLFNLVVYPLASYCTYLLLPKGVLFL